jgi:hypothetical protein
MIGEEISWEDMHHRKYFLPKISCMENGEFKSVVSRSVNRTANPLIEHNLYAEGNMENISKTIPINIYKNLDVVKNIFIGAECSQDDIY